MRKRGAEEAGAVFVKVALLDGTAMLYAPAPQSSYDESRSVDRVFVASPPQAVVFVIDGVGNFGATSVSLGRAIDEASLPLHVQTVEWSHGYGRIFADHMDHCHARNEGRKLAEQIVCYQRPRADGPPLPVYLVAHSGGSAVALAATEKRVVAAEDFAGSEAGGLF